MVIREECLVKLNNRNKVQRQLLQIDYHPLTGVYSIYRSTCQWGCKIIDAPIKTIPNYNVKQISEKIASRKFDNALKYYLDRGYKRLSLFTTKNYKDLKEEDIKTFLNGSFKLQGIKLPKPMLAKDVDKCVHDILEKDWLCCKKINGVRCFMYYKDGMIIISTNNGGNYNTATQHIREDSYVIKLFQTNKDLILDGVLYIHDIDYSYDRINNLAKSKNFTEECKKLHFYVYDYVDDKLFKNRVNDLIELSEIIDSSNISFIEYKLLNGSYKIESLLKKYILEGYSGLYAKNPDKEYGEGKRSSIYMIELNTNRDDRYTIENITCNIRNEYEFILKTKYKEIVYAIPKVQRNYNIENYLNKKVVCLLGSKLVIDYIY